MTVIHDSDGNLTADAMGHLSKYLEKQGAASVCCREPNLVAAFAFGNPTLTFNPDDQKSVVDNKGGGIPLVSLVCVNCSSVKFYLASRIFPEWMAKNKT